MRLLCGGGSRRRGARCRWRRGRRRRGCVGSGFLLHQRRTLTSTAQAVVVQSCSVVPHAAKQRAYTRKNEHGERRVAICSVAQADGDSLGRELAGIRVVDSEQFSTARKVQVAVRDDLVPPDDASSANHEVQADAVLIDSSGVRATEQRHPSHYRNNDASTYTEPQCGMQARHDQG